MSEREKLPDRRESDAQPITHLWSPGTAGEIAEHMVLRIGRYDDGRVGEVFIDYTDPRMLKNERARNLGHDIATILSIALQYGVPIEVMCAAVGRGDVNRMGKITTLPHTPIGTVLDHLANQK